MSEPAVAIITPTRNRAALLRETLDSVAAQTFRAWQHIVVDDGSADRTAEFMAARCAADGRVRYIVRGAEPSGANACRNIGVRATTAPLVVFLDSDDLLTPDCLARRVALMRRNLDFDFATFRGTPFVSAPGDLCREPAGISGDDLCRFLYFDETPWQTSAPIWRRESLMRLGLFDEGLLSWQDIELHVRAITAGCRYIRLPEVDHHVRWQFEPTKVSVEQRRSPAHLRGALDVLERLEAHVRRGPGMTWTRQRALCSLYFATAERWIERGDLGAALACWRTVRARDLAPPLLHAVGVALLTTRRLGAPTATAVRKWKGWSRLRTLPEIVPA